MSVTPLHALGIYASTFLIIAVYTHMLDDFLAPRYQRIWVKWLCAAGLAVLVVLSSFFVAAQRRIPVNIAIYASYVFLLYRGGIGRRLLLVAAHLMMAILAEIVAASAFSPFIDVSAGHAGDIVVGVMTAGTFVVYCLEYLLIKRLRGAIDDRLGKKVWLGIVFCVATIFLSAWDVFYNTPAVREHIRRNGGENGFMAFFTGDVMAMLLMLMLLMVIVLLFWILRSMNQNIRLMHEEELRRQKAVYKQREEKMRAVCAETVRDMRADMTKRLARLEAFRQAGDFEGQHRYIGEMLSGALRAPALPHCGNALLDALFGANAAVMESEGIACRWRLEPVPRALKIDDVNLSALLTNALNNAIEACKRLGENDEKWIAVAVRAERTSLTITVENACQDAEQTVARSRKKSSKRTSGAGYGLGIITDIVHAHAGEIDFAPKNNDAVSLILYLPNIMERKTA